MTIELSGSDGQWEIKDGQVLFALKYTGADGKTRLQSKRSGFPANEEGFGQALRGLQGQIERADHGAQNTNHPVAEASADMATHYRAKHALVISIRNTWRSSCSVPQEGTAPSISHPEPIPAP